MKILFHIINFNLGGTEKSLLNLIQTLSKQDEITILCLEKKGDLLVEFPSNVRIIEIDNAKEINHFLRIGARAYSLSQFKKGQFFSFLLSMLFFLLNKIGITSHTFKGLSNYLESINEEYDYAVAYAGPHDFISYYVLNYIQAKKKLQWIHFDVDKVISKTKFGEEYYKRFDNVISVSQNAKVAFDRKFPLVKSKSKVLQNVVSTQNILQNASQGESFSDEFKGMRIVTLGRLSREKGQQMIPEVIYKLKQDGLDFRWYLIGDGSIREEIETLITHFEIADQLILLGSKLNPYAFLRNCDLYVQTSIHEGYCITLHEAKVFNKPVVTTNFLSAPNLIKDGEDGLIVDISVEGIYQGVRKMLADEAFRLQTSKCLLIKESGLEVKNIFDGQ